MILLFNFHFVLRISISWPRLLPTGFPDKISEDGKRFYNNLINALHEKRIQPVVTLYHWDLPQSLQDLGIYFFLYHVFLLPTPVNLFIEIVINYWLFLEMFFPLDSIVHFR